MKMLKEEKELREYIRHTVKEYCDPPAYKSSGDRKVMGLITALIRAVRADEREKCAKKCDTAARYFAEFADRTKKKGHNVDDIVARRIACEDLAKGIREGKG